MIYYHNYIRNFNDSHIKNHTHKQNELCRQRNYIMLGVLVYQGLHTNELQRINLNNVDLNKATIKIISGKKTAQRTLPLNASQIGFLINYINNIRPQFQEHRPDTEQLFITLPTVSTIQASSNNQLTDIFKPIVKQLKTINKNFESFKQVRASVITNWLKTEGLRKTQYLAGHRYISTTERYLPNNLEGLIDDIAKFNPF
jgi:integrase/recombinase XerD